jgi:hypothetical protein
MWRSFPRCNLLIEVVKLLLLALRAVSCWLDHVGAVDTDLIIPVVSAPHPPPPIVEMAAKNQFLSQNLKFTGPALVFLFPFLLT